MDNNQNNQLDTEIKAYIYQNIQELEIFMGESTTVSVMERNPKTALKKLKNSGNFDEATEATDYCYEFIIEENGQKISSYGFADDPFAAIRIAKEKMFKQLDTIQNEVLSNAERISDLNNVVSKNNTKH